MGLEGVMEEYQEQVTQAYYDREAWRYDNTHGAGQYGAQYSIKTYYRPFWKKHLKRTDAILEIGCGTGVFTQEFSRLVKKIIAIDLSQKMITLAKQRNPAVRFKVASAEQLPFKQHSFDSIVCVNSFSYIADQQKALAEFQRVLKPKGKLLLIDMNLRCPAYWIMYVTRHRRLKLFFTRLLRSTPGKMQETLRENGFTVLKCRGGNFVPHGVGKLRAWLFFILLDRTLGRLPFLRNFGMRVFCAAQAPKAKSLLKGKR